MVLILKVHIGTSNSILGFLLIFPFLLWFGSGMSSRGSCVAGLVPNAAMLRGGALGS